MMKSHGLTNPLKSKSLKASTCGCLFLYIIFESMLVSIIMPVRNTELYLHDCVNSILQQSHTDWELIAVNDGSEDLSLEILKSFSEKDKRVKVLTSKGNGIIAALQTGYEHSTGNVIHRMDSDDIMPHRKLEVLLSKLQHGVVTTGKVEYFSTEGIIGDGFKTYERWLNNVWKTGNGWKDVYRECPIASPAWVMLREDFDQIGGFESEGMPEDYDLVFRVYKHKLRIQFCNEVVHLWRESIGRTSRNERQYFPTAYYPIKVNQFLEIDYRSDKNLVLIGAGRKGKLIARLLLEKDIKFNWVTNNENKLKVPIYGVKLSNIKSLNTDNTQLLIAISSPKDRKEIKGLIKSFGKQEDSYWFC